VQAKAMFKSFEFDAANGVEFLSERFPIGKDWNIEKNQNNKPQLLGHQRQGMAEPLRLWLKLA